MRSGKGFKIGKRLIRISRWIGRKTRCASGSGYGSSKAALALKPITKLISWGRRLKNGAKSICSGKPGPGYLRVGQDPVKVKQEDVPKGHLAVYIGKKDGDFHRVLVPVFYFNHPLFGELLREAEEEYGFSQEGGITIPCRFAEFEKVQTRIAAGTGGRRMPWKRHQ